MSFMIQYQCPKCGYKTRENKYGSVLIDPLDMPDLYICTCNHCHDLFHRKSKDGVVINKCTECGSEDITIQKKISPMPCPRCDEKEMKLECVGTCF